MSIVVKVFLLGSVFIGILIALRILMSVFGPLIMAVLFPPKVKHVIRACPWCGKVHPKEGYMHCSCGYYEEDERG